MKQNKKRWYIAFSAVIILVIASLIAWWLWPKSYADIIPAEAKAVVRIVPSEMAKNGQQDALNPLEKTLGITTDGLDMSTPIYAFVTPNEYIGFAAKVEDKAAIEKQIERLTKQQKCTSTETIDGQQWAWLNAGWLLTWTDRSLLILGPGVAQERDVLRQTMTAMMHSSHNFTSTAKYDSLKAQTGAIQLYAQLDAMPTPYNMLFRLTVPADCDPSAVNIFASVATDRGTNSKAASTVITSCVTSDNQDILNAIDQYEKTKGCVSLPASATTSAASQPLFTMVTRTKGTPLLSLLKTDATLRGLLMGLNSTFDADRMLGSTDGLFSIEIDSLSKDWTPTYCMKAETEATNLFENAAYWLESAKKQKNVSLTRTSANAFVLKNEKQLLHFGRSSSSHALYFASATMLSKADEPFCATKSNGDKGLLVYFHVNLQKLFAQPCLKGNAMSSLLTLLLPGTKDVSYKAEMGRRATLVIE